MTASNPAKVADETLEATLKSVIKRFRARAGTLSPEQAARIQTINDLRAPCQVTAFSFPRIRWHVFVITHSRTAPDKQLRVQENVETWNLFELLETELEDPLWDDAQQDDPVLMWASSEPDPTLRSLGEGAFLTIHHNARVWAAANPERDYSRHLSGSLLGPQIAIRDFHGDVSAIPWDEFLRDAFQNLDPPAPPTPPVPASASTPATQTPPNYPGRGAYHYPTLRIGELPRPRLRNTMAARDALPGILVLQDRLGPHELLVTHNGFFGLMTPDNEEAIRWLNLLMASIRQKGHLSRPVHETELGSFYRPDRDSSLGWGGSWPSWGPDRSERYAFSQPWLSADDLVACLRNAETLDTKSYAAKMPLLLEAEAHLVDHETAQSLIFSWAVIEDVMAQKWDSFITRKGVTGERRKSLRSTREWPFQARLDAMELAGEMQPATYSRLVTTKRVRNDAMHGTAFPTAEQAKAALALAEEVLLSGDPPILVRPALSPWERQLEAGGEGEHGRR